MPERPGRNPYARPVPSGNGSAPNPANERIFLNMRYAVPDIPESTDPDNVDGAWSPSLATTGSPTGTPDDIRIGQRQPPPNSPQDSRVHFKRYNEFFRRASADQTTVGWHVKQDRLPRPIVPEWTQDRPPIRPTQTAAPMGYLFRRPEHHPRNIKDAVGEDAVDHVSMADHRRTWEILGQAPQGRVGRNTYRVPVRPWDENVFIPPEPENASPSALFGRRTYRLGR